MSETHQRTLRPILRVLCLVTIAILILASAGLGVSTFLLIEDLGSWWLGYFISMAIVVPTSIVFLGGLTVWGDIKWKRRGWLRVLVAATFFGWIAWSWYVAGSVPFPLQG